MRLHMYLCRSTKKSIEELNRLKEVENDLKKMWEPIIANEFPRKWYGDKSNMSENQRKLVDEMNVEFDIIEQKSRAIRDEVGSHIGYWRNFNTLHKYIIDNFADGVDDCKEIQLTKDNAVQILTFLNRAIYVLSTSKNWNISNDDSYANNINKAIGIFSMVIREWDDDHVVWYLAF